MKLTSATCTFDPKHLITPETQTWLSLFQRYCIYYYLVEDHKRVLCQIEKLATFSRNANVLSLFLWLVLITLFKTDLMGILYLLLIWICLFSQYNGSRSHISPSRWSGLMQVLSQYDKSLWNIIMNFWLWVVFISISYWEWKYQQRSS